ncbi:sugar O-acetyltransferase [Flavihumibacter sp. ZG627]|uniref:sugar O-acetyltransferase n=1 Tax=Flavihumibacter sp. ZG627 TaxID=1463156 RepID=UPI00057CCC12|nr:sugar O-acetyltransferase [Flavihumibacter sp. ZG627]KIC91277.1 maltose acetyltransferase [Flavihumibacter sp. ZG627]
MPTEKEKMLAGELYNALDEQLSTERTNARILLQQLNNADPADTETLNRTLKALIPNAGQDLWIQPPFYCDYGYNVEAGDKVFFNFNCVVLDVMKVTIGSRTLFGPNVQIYTAMHPVNHAERAAGLEFAQPIVIGEDVWVGGSAVICPGVTIGSRSIIGAGSVVTRDIPEDVFAAGNPCRVIRTISDI